MFHEVSNLQFGEFIVDPRRRQLRRGEEPIPLSGKAFDLLVYMASNSGRLLLKSELMEAVWPDSFVEEANLSQNIFLLRRALGSAGGESVIVTLPGRGYQFAVQVTPVIDVPPATGRPLSDPAQFPVGFATARSLVTFEEETEEHISSLRSPDVRIIAVAALVLVGVAGWLGWKRWEDRVGGPPVQLVMADFDGGTGDLTLDHTLKSAVRIDLAQSPFVSVVSPATVRRTLTEMMHKPDDPLTPGLARDLCERTGSQAVLQGSVARSGERYLLTMDATNCVDGATLGSAKEEARSREDLPRTVDKLAEALRYALGESRRTIARFSVPIFPANTGSVEALEAYSEATLLSYRGELPEAIGLLQKAVLADPNFAAAHLDLSNFYASMGDRANERLEIQKAYALRSSANEPNRLYIEAHYNAAVTGDLFESRRNYVTWTELYPRAIAAWSGLSQMQRELGAHAESVAAEQHAIAINPHVQPLYYQLSLEQMHAGDAAGARATCELALARGMDGELIHHNLLKIAYLQRDAALAAAQVDWADTHPAPHVVLAESSIALAEGRLQDARALLDRGSELLKQQGMSALGSTYAQEFARSFAEMGAPEQAARLLHLGPIDPENPDELIGLAETGNAAEASATLLDQVARRPQDTILNRIDAPEIRAVVALAAHKPDEAITALEASRSFEGVRADASTIRGQAYLQSGKPALAEAEFRRVLMHPEIDPGSYVYPLAQLGLARALTQQGKSSLAADIYTQLLTQWARADGTSAVITRARQEFASLKKAFPPKASKP